MTSLVATNQGLASLLSEVSSIANYKKPDSDSPTTTKSTAAPAIGAETAAAASLLTDVSSIANYKRSNTSGGNRDRPRKSGLNTSGHSKALNTSGHTKKPKGRRNTVCSGTVGSNTKENVNNASTKKDNDNQQTDANNNSTALYEVFDYSMSEVDLPEDAPAKRKAAVKRASCAGKLERLQELQDDASNNNNVSVSDTYNVFDFSLSTVDPKLIEEPTPKKRVSRRGSVGGLSADKVAAARARTRRAGSMVKQTRQEKQQQQQSKPQRPGLVRRNSFGSMRDLNNDKGEDDKPKSPGADKKPATIPESPHDDALYQSPGKSPGRTRRVRGHPRTRRRASMGRVEQAQKQQFVTMNDGCKVAMDSKDKDRMQAVRRLTKIQQSFKNASMAASEHHTTVITACPSLGSSRHGPESPVAEVVEEEDKVVEVPISSNLQTLSQGVKSSLSTLSGLKKKLLRSNTMG